MGLWKKLLHSLWGVDQPAVAMAPPLACDACRIARMNGRDACYEHHNAHPRAHTYKIGGGMDWGSGLERDAAMPSRPSSSSTV